MKVEALIATMDQSDDSILEKMNIRSDAIIVNQCDHFHWHVYEQNGQRICSLSCAERGVGLSRNTALMRAEGDICLFSDDDLIYCNDYVEKLTQTFRDYPKADVIVFNIHSIGDFKHRYQIERPKRIRWFNYMRYGTARIAIKRTSILKKHISFSLLFGGGAKYSSGEDTIFLHDCLKAGLLIYAVPILMADIDDSKSSWFHGYDERFFSDRGALYAAIYGKAATLHSILYLLRHRKVWIQNRGFFDCLRVMRNGSKQFRSRR
ncbi:MAG: glycosyltransferase family 2 protein [Clostridia bacterium]|nr:glycosyltransferase family 2 protein [Clostridia bacterium]